jgi:hypothetical protein
MLLCLYDFADTGDEANTDIGTPIKVCGRDEFAEKIQAKRAGNQNYTGGVSMLKMACFKIRLYAV